MNPRQDETQLEVPTFDFSAFPADTLFLDRRTLPGRPDKPPRPAAGPAAPPSPRTRKERRRRVDPTTFEKQYTGDEIEFMNAIQDFKNRSGKMFPSHGDILQVAFGLSYRKSIVETDEGSTFDRATTDQLAETAASVAPV